MVDLPFLSPITSNQNPLIKQVLALKEKRERDKTKLFLIEGFREIERAVSGGQTIETILVSPDLFLGVNEPALLHTLIKKGAKGFVIPSYLFEKISYRDRGDGLLAIGRQEPKCLEELSFLFKKKENPLFIVLESIEKPGNLGTILRSSDAAKVDAVLVADPCTDIFNPNVVRASVGTLFTQLVVQDSSLRIFDFLKKNNVLILAATPHTDHEYTDVDLKVPLAIAMGTEQLGLTDLWMENADLKVKIPMLGTADSLNVAQATTILLFEAVRQRRKNS